MRRRGVELQETVSTPLHPSRPLHSSFPPHPPARHGSPTFAHLVLTHSPSYWNAPYFTALSLIESTAAQHNLTLAEVALRWLSHHSALKAEYGDAVIIGASSLAHVGENLGDLEKGPLREWCSFFLSFFYYLFFVGKGKLIKTISGGGGEGVG